MNSTDVKLIETTLQDGSVLQTFDDYIGQFIKNTKDYYERNILDFFKDYIPSSAVIYDLGSNIGNHTVYFSKNTNAKQIFAFEPSTETYALLEKNIMLNGINNVEIFNHGVGNQNSKAVLVSNKDNMGASFLTPNDNGDVDIVSLDSMSLPAPDFIKIDVEGFEFQALQGAAELLKKNRPVIWIEIFEQNYEQVDGLLESLGYTQIDRWFDNYVYVNLNNEKDLMHYMKQFKTKPLRRFAEQTRETNRKYKNATSQVSQLNEKLKQTESQYREAKALNAKLSLSDSERLFMDKTKEYEERLKIEQLENDYLAITSTLKEQLISLTAEKQSAIAILAREGNLIPDIIKLQEERQQLREEKLKIELNNEKQNEAIRSEMNKIVKKAENLLIEKDQQINELEIQIKQIEEKNRGLEKMNIDANQKLKEQERQLESTNIALKKKSLEADDLLAQRVELEIELKAAVLDKLTLLGKEEEFLLKLDQEVVKTKKVEHEKYVLTAQHEQLKTSYNKLASKYTALRNSKLGKLTVKYWQVSKKWSKRGK